MNNTELKQAVKESLSLKRTPRNLDIFYLFWMSFHYTKPGEMSYVATSVLQSKLGVKSNDYKKYFQCWVEKFCGKPIKGLQCRNIETWTPNFIQLMERTKRITIPKDFFYKMCHDTLPINNKLKERIKNNSTVISRTLTQDCRYIKTKNSERWYLPGLSEMKTELRHQTILKDCWHIDIESCYSSIMYHEMGLKDDRLDPRNKQYLRAAIMRDFGCNLEGAKRKISILFSMPHKYSWGVKWYDDLHKQTTKTINQWIQDNRWREPEGGWSYHKAMTFMEQRIMENLYTEDNEVFRHHDAGYFEFSNPEVEIAQLKSKAYPHLLSVEWV